MENVLYRLQKGRSVILTYICTYVGYVFVFKGHNSNAYVVELQENSFLMFETVRRAKKDQVQAFGE